MKNKTVVTIGIIAIVFIVSVALASVFNVSNKITANTIWDDEFMEGKQLVKIATTKGDIVVEIYEEKTPITAKNFLDLVNAKFYDGLIFHRYVPGFVVQGGDPRGDGTGGSETEIPLEIAKDLHHDKGVLAMARSSDPNSASSQFYITLDAAPHLDGSYAIFGRVIEGMDVALSLREGDKMTTVSVMEK